MKKIQKAYERIQKAKRRPKHEHSLRNCGMYFSWSIERLQRTTQRRVLAYAPTSTDVFDMFNARKTWRMADLDIFALGKTFQEIVCKKGWALQIEQLLHPNQDLQQAGLRLSGQPWMWNPTSFQRNIKKPHKSQIHHATQITQITSIPPIKPLPSCIDGMIQRIIVAV